MVKNLLETSKFKNVVPYNTNTRPSKSVAVYWIKQGCFFFVLFLTLMSSTSLFYLSNVQRILINGFVGYCIENYTQQLVWYITKITAPRQMTVKFGHESE